MHTMPSTFNIPQGCLNQEDLGALLERAFIRWQIGDCKPDDHRSSPRMSAEGVKPLFVTEVAVDGEVRPLCRKVNIVNVSADGLGIEVNEPLPKGAILRFAFESESGDVGFGEATIVNVVPRKEAYLIGLAFPEKADVLKPVPNTWSKLFVEETRERFQQGANVLLHCGTILHGVLSHRNNRRFSVVHEGSAQRAEFVVVAKLFHYIATLWVNGEKCACTSGVLECRARNLFSFPPTPTPIELQAEGFTGRALVGPNRVLQCRLVTRNRCPVDTASPASTTVVNQANETLNESPSDLKVPVCS